MKSKGRKIVAWIINAAGTIFLFLWLFIFRVKWCFFQVKFFEWFSIFLTFEIAFLLSYYLTNKKYDYEKRIETYESIIIKMQKKLLEDPAHLFSPSFDTSNGASKKIEHYQQSILMYFRSLSNYFDLIKKYCGDLPITEELKFIETHLDDYKIKLTEDFEMDTLKQLKNYVRRETSLIDVKLDEIRLKLH